MPSTRYSVDPEKPEHDGEEDDRGLPDKQVGDLEVLGIGRSEQEQGNDPGQVDQCERHEPRGNANALGFDAGRIRKNGANEEHRWADGGAFGHDVDGEVVGREYRTVDPRGRPQQVQAGACPLGGPFGDMVYEGAGKEAVVDRQSDGEARRQDQPGAEGTGT